MPIDPNIIMGIRPAKIEPYDPVERQAKALGLQDLMRQNYLQEQAIADDRAMREAYRQSGGDANKLKQLLMQGGNYKGVQGVEKFNTDLGKTRAETAEKVTKVTHDTLNQFKDALNYVTNPEDAKQWLAAQYQNPNTAAHISALAPMEQALSKIPTDPEGFNQWKNQAALGMTRYLEMNKPSIHMQDTGGASNIVSVPGMGGAPTVLSSTPITKKPGGEQKIPMAPVAYIDDKGNTVWGTITEAKGRPAANYSPALQGQLAGAKAFGKTTEEERGKAISDAPRIVDNANEAIRLADELLKHPGFKQAVGASSMLGVQKIPGTQARDFMNRLDQIKGGAFLEAFNTLKGGGQITEVEGKKATDAIARMDNSTSEKEFQKAVDDYKNVIRIGVERAKKKAGGISQPTANPYANKTDAEIKAELGL